MAAVNLEQPDTMPSTADEVMLCVTASIFPVERYLCLPNASWGMGLHWEADLLALSEAGLMYETEIKLCMADLKRDTGKRKWDEHLPSYMQPQGMMRAIYFAMPASLAAHPDVPHIVPEFAGILSCRIIHRPGQTYWRADTLRKPKRNSKAPKWSDEWRMKMARLGTMRYWSRQRKQIMGAVSG